MALIDRVKRLESRLEQAEQRIAELEARPPGSYPTSPTFNVVRITGRIEMHFDDTLDANGAPVNAYTELQWINDRNGINYAQLLAHGKGFTGGNPAAQHDHFSLYVYDPTIPGTLREHPFNMTVAGPDGKPILGLWDGIQKEQRWTRVVQAPSGQFWKETIDETTLTTRWVRVAGPTDPKIP
jgi:hypothetical protein